MSLKSDLGKTFRGVKSYAGTYGIEIETETISQNAYPSLFLTFDGEDGDGHVKYKLPPEHMSQWIAKNDGSLRNFGIEYILQEPLSFEQATKALEDFGEGTKNIKFIKEPFSCSVHIHVNMWNETFLTLGNFITTWLLLEGLLTNFCGETRKSNLFAMPTRSSEGTWLMYAKMFSDIEKGNHQAIKFSNNQGKYAVLNICPLWRLGSVEVRCMRGTTDVDLLKFWLSIVNDIFRFASRDHTPRDIVGRFRNEGFDFLKTIFKDNYLRLVEDLDPFEVVQLLDIYGFYAASIADTVRDWRSLDKVFKKKDESNTASLSSIYAELVGNAGNTPEEPESNFITPTIPDAPPMPTAQIQSYSVQAQQQTSILFSNAAVEAGVTDPEVWFDEVTEIEMLEGEDNV